MFTSSFCLPLQATGLQWTCILGCLSCSFELVVEAQAWNLRERAVRLVSYLMGAVAEVLSQLAPLQRTSYDCVVPALERRYGHKHQAEAFRIRTSLLTPLETLNSSCTSSRPTLQSYRRWSQVQVVRGVQWRHTSGSGQEARKVSGSILKVPTQAGSQGPDGSVSSKGTGRRTTSSCAWHSLRREGSHMHFSPAVGAVGS